ncbi:unnamed protein product [Brachionus calyciflorus]|uniref:Uncharacterized protein n=1 Tax=Brachionus calyciflorus TaxID=104777 RepID=A0A814KFI3_9BILA|nr:unnamed protein product [Brachionus calyciflorus]
MANCGGNRQCNNDICKFLFNKTLSSNKYTIDVLLKEGVVNLVDKILISKQVSYEIKSMENKLASHSFRLSDLEKITQKHSGELKANQSSIESYFNLVLSRMDDHSGPSSSSYLNH